MPDDRECLVDEPTPEARPIAFPEATGWAEGPSAEGLPFQRGEQPDGTLQAVTCWELTDEAIAELVRTRCLYVGVRGERPVAMWLQVTRHNVFYRPAKIKTEEAP